MNCEGPYLVEGFLHNLCPCFNTAFIRTIIRTRNKFIEIAAASERYSIINSGIKEPAVPTMPSRKISWWKNVNKKGKNFFVTNLQSYQFQQGDWKHINFFRKISWIWTCSQISRKYWENLLLFWMKLNKASAHLYNLGNNIYSRKNSPTDIYLFVTSHTKKGCEVCSNLTIRHQNDVPLPLLLTLYPFLLLLLLTLNK